MQIGDTYDTNKYGKIKIIDLVPGREVGYKSNELVAKIQFLDTGFTRYSKLWDIRKGTTRDYCKKTIFGVGYLGNNRNISFTQREYRLWYKMMDRCYNKDSNMYRFYGAKGVKVDERWHCFTTFILDLPSLPGYDEYINSNSMEYNLDKDLLQQGVPYENKIYSKGTCCFVKSEFNSRLSTMDKKIKESLSSNYIGVHVTSTGRFSSCIEINTKRYRLGDYSDEIAAATVYNYIAERCCINPILNDIPYIDINEALSYRTSLMPLHLPDNIDATNLNIPQNKSSKYKGIVKRGGTRYEVHHKSTNSRGIIIGTFKTEQAALNARNWYDSFFNNGLEFQQPELIMDPVEWLKYRTYARGYVNHGEMCKIIR